MGAVDDLGLGDGVANLQLREEILPLHHVPKHRIPPVQQIRARRRQLRLLRTDTAVLSDICLESNRATVADKLRVAVALSSLQTMC